MASTELAARRVKQASWSEIVIHGRGQGRRRVPDDRRPPGADSRAGRPRGGATSTFVEPRHRPPVAHGAVVSGAIRLRIVGEGVDHRRVAAMCRRSGSTALENPRRRRTVIAGPARRRLSCGRRSWRLALTGRVRRLPRHGRRPSSSRKSAPAAPFVFFAPPSAVRLVASFENSTPRHGTGRAPFVVT